MSQSDIPSDRRREDRREASHAHKRAEILASARRIFARDGAKGLTIRAVATEAGYVPGAVYFYFHSKAAILSELAVHELAGLTKQLRATSTRDAAERAAAAAEAFATAHTIFNMDFEKEGVNPGSERMLLGRLISLFQTVSEPLELDGLPPEQAQARALGLSSALAAAPSPVLHPKASPLPFMHQGPFVTTADGGAIPWYGAGVTTEAPVTP